jgi:hypothetical protein
VQSRKDRYLGAVEELSTHSTEKLSSPSTFVAFGSMKVKYFDIQWLSSLETTGALKKCQR